MTQPVRNSIPTPLEEEYSKLRKQLSNGNKKNPNRVIVVATGQGSKSPTDTVTLSSKLEDSETPPKLKPSQSVNTDEKKALHTPLSVYT